MEALKKKIEEEGTWFDPNAPKEDQESKKTVPEEEQEPEETGNKGEEAGDKQEGAPDGEESADSEEPVVAADPVISEYAKWMDKDAGVDLSNTDIETDQASAAKKKQDTGKPAPDLRNSGIPGLADLAETGYFDKQKNQEQEDLQVMPEDDEGGEGERGESELIRAEEQKRMEEHIDAQLRASHTEAQRLHREASNKVSVLEKRIEETRKNLDFLQKHKALYSLLRT